MELERKGKPKKYNMLLQTYNPVSNLIQLRSTGLYNYSALTKRIVIREQRKIKQILTRNTNLPQVQEILQKMVKIERISN